MRQRSAVRVTFLVVLVIGSLSLASCEWPQYGYGPGNTRSSPYDTGITAANVGSLQQTWSADITGRTVVAASKVLVVGRAPGAAPSVPRRLYAYDVTGVEGCSGTPKICTPVWQSAAELRDAAPVVMGTTVFAVSSAPTGGLLAFDAAGGAGCAGTPSVCQPRWQAADVSGISAAGSLVYGNFQNEVKAFDAAGNEGCSGSPKVCLPLWRGVPECAGVACSVGMPVIADGRLFVSHLVNHGLPDEVIGGPFLAFDAAGVAGCSGTPNVCAPLATFGGGVGTVVPAAADGRVYDVRNTQSEDGFESWSTLSVHGSAGNLLWATLLDSPAWPTTAFAYPPAVVGNRLYVSVTGELRVLPADGAGCTSTSCPVAWRANGVAAPTAANGLVFDSRGQVFDAAGVQGCAGSPTPTCTSLTQIGPATQGDLTIITSSRVFRPLSTGLRVFELPA